MLLERLRIPFEVQSPDVDENPLTGEAPERLVARLAGSKARVVAKRFPERIVIGSDQVAVCNGEIIGKPGNASAAVSQLQRFSGRTVRFLTAISVVGEDSQFKWEDSVSTEVCFRKLAADEIERYIDLDKPFDCAGSFKSEAAGIGLLSAMKSTDPTAIIGLPLIATARALRKAGFKVP